jgi:BlaI family penicillinase repressor
MEWTLIRAVWGHQPCAAGTVQEALSAERGWAYSTVKTMLDRMVAKGLLSTHSVRNLTLYTALISPTDAKRGEFRRFLRRAFDGALSPMLQFLVEDEELSPEELRELRKLVNRRTRRAP